MPARPFNGHPSWNQWNVSLWINNDESLYRMAQNFVREYGYSRGAQMLARELHGQKTPDGGRYNLTAIRNAIRGMAD